MLVARIRVTDGPHRGTSTYAQVVQFADGVLVTVRRGVSTLDAARLGKEALDLMGARIVGVAELGAEEGPAASGYSGYYSSSGASVPPSAGA